MFELGVCDVVVLLLDILARLHQLGHLVAVEDLLLLLRTALPATLPSLLLHARPLWLCLGLPFYLDVGRVLVAEVFEEVGALID